MKLYLRKLSLNMELVDKMIGQIKPVYCKVVFILWGFDLDDFSEIRKSTLSKLTTHFFFS